MTWTNLQDGTPADAAEVDANFKHVRQGHVLPMAPGFVPTSGVYDLGSSSYLWDKSYVSEIASTCTVAAEISFNAPVVFAAAPTFSIITAYPQQMVCRGQYASGTGGGTITSTAITDYVQLELNTVTVNLITGATLSANQVTLPAGSYMTSFYVICDELPNLRAAVWDTTASTTVCVSNKVLNGNGKTQIMRCIFDSFTILTSTALELRLACDRGASGLLSTDLGAPCSFSDTELYRELVFYKIT